MAAEAACTGGLLCKITQCAALLYANPLVAVPLAVVAIFAVIGLVTAYRYYREHGARETAKTAWTVFWQSQYTSYNVLKHLKAGPVLGAIFAAIAAFIAGVPHIFPHPHKQSEHASTERSVSRDLVPAAPTQVAKVTPPASTAASSIDPTIAADIAVQVARHFPDRKVEVRQSNIAIIVHSRDDGSDVRPA